tara:strand:+ start:33315 stop:33671 length:357 start_codon:yes stop_codon:yes gene_type:complete
MTSPAPRNISPKQLDAWLKQNDSNKPFFVDVRENQELEIAPFSYPVCHLPLSQEIVWIGKLSQKLPPNRPLIVICHSGIRSMNFGIWLLSQGVENDVWNLEGGIDQWSMDVDPSIARY